MAPGDAVSRHVTYSHSHGCGLRHSRELRHRRKAPHSTSVQDLQPSIEPGPLMASSVAPTVLRNDIQVGMGIALSSKSLNK